MVPTKEVPTKEVKAKATLSEIFLHEMLDWFDYKCRVMVEVEGCNEIFFCRSLTTQENTDFAFQLYKKFDHPLRVKMLRGMNGYEPGVVITCQQ